MKWDTTVINGKTHVGRLVIDAIRGFEGKKITIEVKLFKKQRSQKQEAFYRAVALPMIREHENHNSDVPYSLEAIHKWCKRIMGRTEMQKMPDGELEEIEISNGNKKITTKMWEDDLEKLRAYYATQGLEIPFPREGLI